MAAETERWDPVIWAAAAGLTLASLIGLRSAAATLDPSLLAKQAVWAGLGAALAFLAASVRYTHWVDAGVLLMPVALAMLSAVLIGGTAKLGAARWLTVFGFSMQPTEFVKLTVACMLARYLGGRAWPISFRTAMASLLAAGVPALLVFVQPDLGSSTVLGAMWVGCVVCAGLSRRVLVRGSLAAAVAAPLGWWLLKDYQRMRLLSFLNPEADPLGAGYTIIQSRIAIGSGRLLGKGWMEGTQSHLHFLPERHSDFLFSVLGEEWGFLGALAVVGLFALLLWRILALALATSEPQGRILALALASWIGYQAVVNMGMVMGLVPVVGVPLPFIGYGGSAMVSVWIAVGLTQSVGRFRTRF